MSADEPGPGIEPGGKPRDAAPEAAWLRILSVFLEERTIRWLLGLGVVLMLAGIATLVVKNWNFFQDHPTLQYLLMVLLAGTLSTVGHLSRVHAGLPRTAYAFDLLALLSVPLDLAALALDGMRLLKPPLDAAGWLSLLLVLASYPVLYLIAERSLSRLVGGACPGLAVAVVATVGIIAPLSPLELLKSLPILIPILLFLAAVTLITGLSRTLLARVVDTGAGDGAPVLLGLALFTLALDTILLGGGWPVRGLSLLLASFMAMSTAASLTAIHPRRSVADLPASLVLGAYLASFVGLSLAFGGDWLGNGTLGFALILSALLYGSAYVVHGRAAPLLLAIASLCLTILHLGWIYPPLHEILAAVFRSILGEGASFNAIPLLLVVIVLERMLGIVPKDYPRTPHGALAAALSVVAVALTWSARPGRWIMLLMVSVLHGIGAMVHREKDLLVLAGLELATTALGLTVGFDDWIGLALPLTGLALAYLVLGMSTGRSLRDRLTSFTGWDRVLHVSPLELVGLLLLGMGVLLSFSGATGQEGMRPLLPLVVQGTVLLGLWRWHDHRVRKITGQEEAPSWVWAIGVSGLAVHALTALWLTARIFTQNSDAESATRDVILVTLLGSFLLHSGRLLGGALPPRAMPGLGLDPFRLTGHMYLALMLLTGWVVPGAGGAVSPIVMVAYLLLLPVRPRLRPLLTMILVAAESTVLFHLPAGWRADGMAWAGILHLVIGWIGAGAIRRHFDAWPASDFFARSCPPLELALLHLPFVWSSFGVSGTAAWITVLTLLAVGVEFRFPGAVGGGAVVGVVSTFLVMKESPSVALLVPQFLVMATLLLYPLIASRRAPDFVVSNVPVAGHVVGFLLAVRAAMGGEGTPELAALLSLTYTLLFATSLIAARNREGDEGFVELGLLMAAAVETACLALALWIPDRHDMLAVAGFNLGFGVLAAAMRPRLGDRWTRLAGWLTDVTLVNVTLLFVMMGNEDLGAILKREETRALILAAELAAMAATGILGLLRHPEPLLAWGSTMMLAGSSGAIAVYLARGGTGGILVLAIAALAATWIGRWLDGKQPWGLLRAPLHALAVGAFLGSLGKVVQRLDLILDPHLRDFLGFPSLWETKFALGMVVLAFTALSWEAIGWAGASWLAVLVLAPVVHGGVLVRVSMPLQPAVLALIGGVLSVAGRFLGARCGSTLDLARPHPTTLLVAVGDLLRMGTTLIMVTHLQGFPLVGLGIEPVAASLLVLAVADLVTLGVRPTESSGLMALGALLPLGWLVSDHLTATPADAMLLFAGLATGLALLLRGRAIGEPPAWGGGRFVPAHLVADAAIAAAVTSVTLAIGADPAGDPTVRAALRIMAAGLVPLLLSWVRSSLPREALGLGMVCLAGFQLAAVGAGSYDRLAVSAWLPAACLALYFTFRGVGHAIERAGLTERLHPGAWLDAGRGLALLGGPAVYMALLGDLFPSTWTGLGRTLLLLAMELIFLRSRRREWIGDTVVSQSSPVILLGVIILQVDVFFFGEIRHIFQPHFWPVLSAVLMAVGLGLELLANAGAGKRVEEFVAAPVLTMWSRIYRLASLFALLPTFAGAFQARLPLTLDLIAAAILLPLAARNLPEDWAFWSRELASTWPMFNFGLAFFVPIHALLGLLHWYGIPLRGEHLVHYAPLLGIYLFGVSWILQHLDILGPIHQAVLPWLPPARRASFGRALQDAGAGLACVPLLGLGSFTAAASGWAALGTAVLILATIRMESPVVRGMCFVDVALTAHHALWVLAAHLGLTALYPTFAGVLNLLLAALWSHLPRPVDPDDDMIPEVIGRGGMMSAGAWFHRWMGFALASIDILSLAMNSNAPAVMLRACLDALGLLMLRPMLGTLPVDLALAVSLGVFSRDLDHDGLRDAIGRVLNPPVPLSAWRDLVGHLTFITFLITLEFWLMARLLAGPVFATATRGAALLAGFGGLGLSLLCLDGSRMGCAWLLLSLTTTLITLTIHGRAGLAGEPYPHWVGDLYRRAFTLELGLIGVQALMVMAAGNPVERLFLWPTLSATALALATLCRRAAGPQPDGEKPGAAADFLDRASLLSAATLWTWVSLVTHLTPLVAAPWLAISGNGGAWLPPAGALVASGFLAFALSRHLLRVALPLEGVALLVLAALQQIAAFAGEADAFHLMLRPWGAPVAGLLTFITMRMLPYLGVLPSREEDASWVRRVRVLGVAASALLASAAFAWSASRTPEAYAGFAVGLLVQVLCLLRGMPLAFTPALGYAGLLLHALVGSLVRALIPELGDWQLYVVWPAAAFELGLLSWLCHRLADPLDRLEGRPGETASMWGSILAGFAGGAAFVTLVTSLRLLADPSMGIVERLGPTILVLGLYMVLRRSTGSWAAHAGLWAAALTLTTLVTLHVMPRTNEEGVPWRLIAAMFPQGSTLFFLLAFTPLGAAVTVSGAIVMKFLDSLVPFEPDSPVRPWIEKGVLFVTGVLTLTGMVDIFRVLPGVGLVLGPDAPQRLVLLAAALSGLLLSSAPGSATRRPMGTLCLVYLLAAMDIGAWRFLPPWIVAITDRMLLLAAIQCALGLALRALARRPGLLSRIWDRESLTQASFLALTSSAFAALLAPGVPAVETAGFVFDLAPRVTGAALLLLVDGVLLQQAFWAVTGVVYGLIATHLIAWQAGGEAAGWLALQWPVWALLELGLALMLDAARSHRPAALQKVLPDGALRALRSILVTLSLGLALVGVGTNLERANGLAPLVTWAFHAALLSALFLGWRGELWLLLVTSVTGIHAHLVYAPFSLAAPTLAAVVGVWLHLLVHSLSWVGLERLTADPDRVSLRRTAASAFMHLGVFSSLGLLHPRLVEAGPFALRFLVMGLLQVVHLVRLPVSDPGRIVWEYLSLGFLGAGAALATFEQQHGWGPLGMMFALVVLTRVLDLAAGRSRDGGPIARIWRASVLEHGRRASTVLVLLPALQVFAGFPRLEYGTSLQILLACVMLVTLRGDENRTGTAWFKLISLQLSFLHVAFTLASHHLPGKDLVALLFWPVMPVALAAGHSVLWVVAGRAGAGGAAWLPVAVLRRALPLWEVLIALTLAPTLARIVMSVTGVMIPSSRFELLDSLCLAVILLLSMLMGRRALRLPDEGEAPVLRRILLGVFWHNLTLLVYFALAFHLPCAWLGKDFLEALRDVNVLAFVQAAILMSLAARGPFAPFVAGAVLRTWQEGWALLSSVTVITMALPHVAHGPMQIELFVTAAAMLLARLVVPNLAQDVALTVGLLLPWVAMARLTSGLPPGERAVLEVLRPLIAMLMGAVTLRMARALLACGCELRPTWIPKLPDGRVYQEGVRALLVMAPAVAWYCAADALSFLRDHPLRAAVAFGGVVLLQLPTLFWMRRRVHRGNAEVLEGFWRGAVQLAALATASFAYWLSRELWFTPPTSTIGIWVFGNALVALVPVVVLRLVHRCVLPDSLHARLETPSGARVTDLFLDPWVIPVTSQVTLHACAVFSMWAFGILFHDDFFVGEEVAGFAWVVILHLGFLVLDRGWTWQVTFPFFLTSWITIITRYFAPDLQSLFVWPVLPAVWALMMIVIDRLSALPLGDGPLMSSSATRLTTGSLRLGAWLGSLACVFSIAPEGTLAVRWLAAALLHAFLTCAAGTGMLVRMCASSSLLLVAASVGKAAVDLEGRIIGDTNLPLFAWPSLALAWVVLAEACQQAARAMARRMDAGEKSPDWLLVWRPSFEGVGLFMWALATLAAFVTLVTNLAQGPGLESGLRLAVLALVVAPLSRAGLVPGADHATPALASFAFYWATLGGIDFRRPALAVAQLQFATAGLALFWYLASHLGRRWPSFPFLPPADALVSAGKVVFELSAWLGIATVPFVMVAASGSVFADTWLSSLAGTALPLAVLGLWALGDRSPARRDGLSGLFLIHATCIFLSIWGNIPPTRWLMNLPYGTGVALTWWLISTGGRFAVLTRSRLVLGSIAPLWLADLGGLMAAWWALKPFGRFVSTSLGVTAAMVAGAVVIAGVSRRGPATPGGFWRKFARYAWPFGLVLASVHLGIVALQALIGSRDVMEVAFLTPTFGLLLLFWRVVFRRLARELVLEETRVPRRLAERLEAGGLENLAVVSDHLLLPLSIVPYFAAIQPGALTVLRLAMSILIQVIVFRERRSDLQRWALGLGLGLVAIHIPLAALGVHGNIQESLPQLAVSLLAGAFLLEGARKGLERLDEPALERMVGYIALASASGSLPAVFASVWVVPDPGKMPLADVLMSTLSLMLLSGYYLWQGAKRRSEIAVYLGEVALVSIYGYLNYTGMLPDGAWTGVITVLFNFGLFYAARQAQRLELATFSRPLSYSSFVVPVVLVLFELHGVQDHPWRTVNMLLASGAFYSTAVYTGAWRNLQYLAAICYNIALFIAWYQISGRDGQHQIQGYLTCVGGTLLWIVHANRDVFSTKLQGNLRMLATLMLMTGPVVEWLQRGDEGIFVMGGTAIAVATLGVLLRIRVLFFSGCLVFTLSLGSFLLQLSRASTGFRTLILLGGGAGAIATAAFFEKRREKVLEQLRSLQDRFEDWE